jgi:hypothetical protein
MASPVALFRLDFYRHTPEQHDAACRSAERELRAGGAFDALGLVERRDAIARAVNARLPWGAGLVARLQSELRDGSYYADLLVNTGAGLQYRESAVLGTLDDKPELLRKAFANAVAWAGNLVPEAVYCDEEGYRLIVERFDFKRFAQDHRRPAAAGSASRRVPRYN